ncbi:hypothetical protein CCP4SC76_6480003 [Gammaproteobacteria bacterium]
MELDDKRWRIVLTEARCFIWPRSDLRLVARRKWPLDWNGLGYFSLRCLFGGPFSLNDGYPESSSQVSIHVQVL